MVAVAYSLGCAMARNATLKGWFTDIDHEYARRFGKYPDYDYTDRLAAGQSSEAVSALINGRMHEIYMEKKSAKGFRVLTKHEYNPFDERKGI